MQTVAVSCETVIEKAVWLGRCMVSAFVQAACQVVVELLLI